MQRGIIAQGSHMHAVAAEQFSPCNDQHFVKNSCIVLFRGTLMVASTTAPDLIQPIVLVRQEIIKSNVPQLEKVSTITHTVPATVDGVTTSHLSVEVTK